MQNGDIGKETQMNTIEQQVIKLIQQYAVNGDVAITGNTRLFEDLGYDSIAVIQLLVAVEEAFGFECDDFDECTEAFESVSAFIKFVRERVEYAADKN